jgi:hypothetical protein
VVWKRGTGEKNGMVVRVCVFVCIYIYMCVCVCGGGVFFVRGGGVGLCFDYDGVRTAVDWSGHR